ncbi:MAG: hypothetical protein J6D29_02980 [Solobacterium sp.]|nr:hypothetical protein [Solobacterium sp.]
MGMFILSTLLKNNEAVLEGLKEKEEIFGEDSEWLGMNIDGDPFEAAKELSQVYHVPAIGIMCNDSDVGMLKLFDKEEATIVTAVEEELLEENSIYERNHNIDYLKNYLVEPYTIEDIYQELNKQDVIFAEDVLFEILKMLGVEEEIIDSLGMDF